MTGVRTFSEIDEALTNPAPGDHVVGLLGTTDVRFTLAQIKAAVAGASIVQSTSTYIVDNGCSVVFATQPTFPTAFYDSTTNVTWVAWQGTSPTGLRAEYISTFDHTTQAWSPQIFVFNDPLGQTDDHGVPSIVRDAAGYVHMFGGSHANALVHYYTTNPDDPTVWTHAANVTSNASYPQAFMVGSQMFLFVRGPGIGSESQYQLYKSSSIVNGAVTWNSVVSICDAGGTPTQIELGQPTIHNGIIYLLFTPVVGGARTNIFLLLYNTADGSVNNIAGTHPVAAGSLPINAAALASFFQVKTNSETTFTVPTACFDRGGNYHLLWSDATGGPDLLLHSVWSGSSWSASHTVFTAAAGNVSFIPLPLANGGIRVIYVGTSLAAAATAGNSYDIYTQTRDSGGTWSSAVMLQEVENVVLPSAANMFFVSPVFNGLSTFEAVWGECSINAHINNNNVDNYGNLRGWAWGESGYVQGMRSGIRLGPMGGGQGISNYNAVAGGVTNISLFSQTNNPALDGTNIGFEYDNNGVWRTVLFDDGSQFWQLDSAGIITYSTPGGEPGISIGDTPITSFGHRIDIRRGAIGSGLTIGTALGTGTPPDMFYFATDFSFRLRVDGKIQWVDTTAAGTGTPQTGITTPGGNALSFGNGTAAIACGPLTLSVGSSNVMKFVTDTNPGGAGYNVISLNGVTSDAASAGLIGLVGGGDADANLYLNVGAAGQFVFVVNGASISTAITSTFFSTPLLKTMTALVATGGGGSTAAFAANSVGGTGQPTTAAQAGWEKGLDSTGATIWRPVWK